MEDDIMFIIKRMGEDKDLHYSGTEENAIKILKDEACIYGFADLLKDGEYLYTAVRKEGLVSTKLIKH
jgi:hypothetical protein